MIQLLNDPSVAVIGMVGLGVTGFVLVKVYSKVISRLH
ncbi:hypothetical protein EDC17_101916 [Sphingobacterium alimentarium]|jgi:hypothetical protein|uniref:Uncharacterized protein n=1 Tax=Sphingobacterium alimentarium TaxID=797292 RepID=A0A4R3VT48_9SPHI|nr:hypothetical protein EDC17_101916 [Sphingobacterium alimentarium]